MLSVGLGLNCEYAGNPIDLHFNIPLEHFKWTCFLSTELSIVAEI